ncbi:MAG: redox-regulated ATPase YchF [Candidatus Spechtbacteria bacterium]|nr:redox-regulated ATPase YchF [Candidatus Spechtbacteria bacterium]
MSLSIGIVGLPNVGKSTLFKALTKKEVDIANYPFCTIDPNVGVVEVPDERLQKLSDLSHSKKIVPAVVEFVDIAGLVRGANKGEGLGNQFLSRIRDVDAILYMVRLFEDSEIHHVEETIDPLRDVDIVQTELILKDLETVEKRLERARPVRGNASNGARKDAKSGSKEIQIEVALLEELASALGDGKGALTILKGHEDSADFTAKSELLKSYQLLTAKPGMFVLNIKDAQIIILENVKQYIANTGFPYVALNAREELEGAGFTASERKELGLGEAHLGELIVKAYEVLNLITFLTTGEDESRAWTIKRGTKAPQAAGVIHTDFDKNFIRAEVIGWQELLEIGGWSEARMQGKLRLEGKDYVVQDGDVMVIRHG